MLKRAVQNDVYAQYDYILFDCRTLLDLLVSNAMNASDYIVIPVECGVFSFDGLEKMLNKVTSINNSTNKNLRVLGILLNKFNRTNVSSSIVDSVREEYEKLTFDTVIPFCPAQSETAVLNQKCCVDDKNSSMGVAFTRVSEEILNRIEE